MKKSLRSRPDFSHQLKSKANRPFTAHACALSWLGRPTSEAPLHMWLSGLTISNNLDGYPISYELRMLGRAPLSSWCVISIPMEPIKRTGA